MPQRIMNVVTDHYPLVDWARTTTRRLITHRSSRKCINAEVAPHMKQAGTAPEPTSETISKADETTASVLASSITSSRTTSDSNLPYPNSTVKQTWLRGCPRTDGETTVEEVLRKDQLDLTMLPSSQWDEEWMISKLDMRRTKILLPAFAKTL
ncbi:hypothetical protein V8C43DRAFT_300150 [Trichoderma afarasin]